MTPYRAGWAGRDVDIPPAGGGGRPPSSNDRWEVVELNSGGLPPSGGTTPRGSILPPRGALW